MAGKHYSATLHRRGGITMAVEVPDPVPDAILRPAEIPGPDPQAGAPLGYGERLYRRRSSDDGTLHYVQDHDLPEPNDGPRTNTPTRCSACGRGSAMFFVHTMARTEMPSPTTARLCADCYPSHAK